MKYLMKFMTAVAVVFIFTAVASDALSKHTPDTRDYWMATVDYDVFGNPSIAPGFEPRGYATAQECVHVGMNLTAVIKNYQPKRRFVMLCITPDDEENLDEVLERVIEDFRKFFTPPKGGA